jgi:hypothetical protein
MIERRETGAGEDSADRRIVESAGTGVYTPMVPWPTFEERSFQSPSRSAAQPRKLVGSPATRHHSDRFLDGSPTWSPPSNSLMSSPRSDARSIATIPSPGVATPSPTKKQHTFLELKPMVDSGIAYGFSSTTLGMKIPVAAPVAAPVGVGSPRLGSPRALQRAVPAGPMPPQRLVLREDADDSRFIT